MDALIHVLDDPEHIKEYGNFNQYPPGWTEISEMEFARGMFFRYAFEKMEYRQMMRNIHNEEKDYVDARLFFFHDKTGVAIHNDHNQGRLHYYRFGCRHNFQAATEQQLRDKKHWPLARTETAAVCEHCGTWRFTDSSD